MAKSPAFQFYPADYLADAKVQMLTLQEEGMYLRLIFYCWREGSIPNDPELLARLCKGTSVPQNVVSLFSPHPADKSRLIHTRLERDREAQKAYSERQHSAGIASGKARREKALAERTKRERILNHNGTGRSNLVRTRTNSSSSSSSSKRAAIAAERASAAFSSIGFDRPFGHGRFQTIWIEAFQTDEPWLTQKMELCIQRCQRKHIGVPPQFYDAKRDVEARENAIANQRSRRTPL